MATTFTGSEIEMEDAMKSAHSGPVYIADKGIYTHVLLTMAEYQKLYGRGKSILELLAMPEGTPEFDFDPPRLSGYPREIDLS
ncbi:hypothetical protein SAMN05421770_10153 [Granulicella rosea]|uniref:Prevent-host-death family protein n=1 Tax=Granulicella rosea TaxID=474952 RepID=A0A239CRD2_9BACT|nr:type II toxin-antitoxin system Phd/YefM family antitoxin [Granulicella rosea]SNS22318.1 hypothetical protein SAMN05421770_10153 [Granulicella rosea]